MYKNNELNDTIKNKLSIDKKKNTEEINFEKKENEKCDKIINEFMDKINEKKKKSDLEIDKLLIELDEKFVN